MFAFSTQQQSRTPTTEIDSSTPFVASSDGDLSLLQQSLIHLSVPPSITDSNGLTPLHSAASYNHLHVIRWLLSQQDATIAVDVNARDSDGDTPLHHCDNESSARVLIEEGRANHCILNEEGKSALTVKEEELRDIQENRMEEDSDDEDVEALAKLVAYLKGLP